MKFLVIALFAVSAVLSEPVGYSYNKPEESNVIIQKVEVYEVPYVAEESSSNATSVEPPQTNGPPAQEYGPPAQEYGPPAQEYGPPKPEENAENITTTESYVTTSSKLQKEKLEEFTDEGVYYIYHPDGSLQKVLYATNEDVRNMEYSAKLKYEDVKPIREPIYTYDPNTYVFKKLVV